MQKVSMSNYQKSCHVDTTLSVIGGKWKLVILWHLTQGRLRFGELKKRIIGITEKMLSQQLKEMESDKLISRKVYPQIPPKVEYSITKHGISLQSVLKELDAWGSKHKTHSSTR
jgi:DNA-binding HxlR family transcriptional regulator